MISNPGAPRRDQRDVVAEALSRARSTRAGSSSATATTTAASPAARMERPALQRLLRDVESGVIDVIVVYKVDRLSRSLTDFARIVEVFDKHNVSFVSITQQFNTTTSMGRLTLNILLSFAQFEREVIGERIRDKFAASRRKGMWMGGTPPLGYDVVDRKLVVNETEAELVRLDLQAVPARRLGDQAGAGTAPRRPHDEIVDDAGRQAPAGQADRQGRDLQDPRATASTSARRCTRGRSYPGEHAGDHRSRDLGQGPRHPRREYGRSRQRHARADAGVAARPDLRARRPRDDAVAHAQRPASSTATTSPPTPSARATRNARCAACRRPRSRKRSSRRCGTCCARPRSSRGRGRRRSTRREAMPEREVVKTITDFAPLWDELFPAEQARIVRLLVERVDLVARWHAGAAAGRRAADAGRGAAVARGQGGMKDEAQGRRRELGVRRLDDHRPHPDDLEAPRRPQGDHRAGRRRRLGAGEATAGRDADPRAGAGASVEADAGGGEVPIGRRDRRSGGRHPQLRQPAAAADAAGAGHQSRRSSTDGSRRGCSWRS